MQLYGHTCSRNRLRFSNFCRERQSEHPSDTSAWPLRVLISDTSRSPWPVVTHGWLSSGIGPSRYQSCLVKSKMTSELFCSACTLASHCKV